MTTKVLDIINAAGRLIGVIRKGEAFTADEANDGLSALNSMLSSWSNESLHIYARTWENFPLSGGIDTYTIGTGQTFNTVRPIYIVNAYVRNGGVDYPLQAITDEQYQDIQFKSIQSTWPLYYNYDNGYPVAKLRFYWVPSTDSTFYMLSEKQLNTFNAVTDTYDMPPGWEEALRYNLAIRMAPEFGVRPDPLVLRNADDAKMNIKKAVSKNRQLPYAGNDINRKQNIYTGWYG